MKALFFSVLEASIHGSVVIFAVLALRLLLKKAPRSMICLLWLLVGLRLVLPFEIESPLSLQPQLAPPSQTQIMDTPLPGIVTPVTPPEENPAATFPAPEISPTEDSPTFSGKTESTTFLYWEQDGQLSLIDFGTLAAGVWLAGILALCVSSIFSYFRLKRQVRSAMELEAGCWECRELDSAFVLGFFPARIYLPAGLSPEDRDFILAHEKAHISRRDHWWKLLGYGILTLHWFNPLVWAAYSLLCRDIELACDEAVVRHMDMRQRKAYSRALLNCAGSHRTIAACPVAFGETSVKQRILSVLNYKKPRFWVCLLAVAALVFVSVCLLTSPGDSPSEPFEELTAQEATELCRQAYQHMQSSAFHVKLDWSDREPVELWVSGEIYLREVSGLSPDFMYCNGQFLVRIEDPDRYAPGLTDQWTWYRSLSEELQQAIPQIDREKMLWEVYDWEALNYTYLSHEIVGDNLEVTFSVPARSTSGGTVAACEAIFTLNSEGELIQIEDHSIEDGHYGSSQAGNWRNVTVILSQDHNEVNTAIFSAYATVPASPDAYLDQCRQALEALQERRTWHIIETNRYSTGNHVDSESTVEYWYDSAFWDDQIGWMRRSHVETTGNTSTYLYLYDNLFSKLETNNPRTEAKWTCNTGFSPDHASTWLHSIRWDNQPIDFVSATYDGEGMTVLVTIHSTPPTLRWDGVTEYQVYFCFDAAGNLYGADLYCSAGSTDLVSSIRIQDTSDLEVRSMIQDTYTQLPTNIFLTIPRNPVGYTQQCKQAVEDLQAAKTYSLLMDRNYTGNAQMPGTTVYWYKDGEDWMLNSESGHADTGSLQRFLTRDGQQYSLIAQAGESSGWVEGFQGAEVAPPWLCSFDWDAQDVTFVSHEENGTYEQITFNIQSAPDSGITHEQVTFWFDSGRQLKQCVYSYTISDSLHCTVTIYLHPLAPEDVPGVIENYYRAATQE